MGKKKKNFFSFLFSFVLFLGAPNLFFLYYYYFFLKKKKKLLLEDN